MTQLGKKKTGQSNDENKNVCGVIMINEDLKVEGKEMLERKRDRITDRVEIKNSSSINKETLTSSHKPFMKKTTFLRTRSSSKRNLDFLL